MNPVDGIYYWMRARTQDAALAYGRGECSWDTVSSLATHLVIEMRKLNDQNLIGILRLPQA